MIDSIGIDACFNLYIPAMETPKSEENYNMSLKFLKLKWLCMLTGERRRIQTTLIR